MDTTIAPFEAPPSSIAPTPAIHIAIDRAGILVNCSGTEAQAGALAPFLGRPIDALFADQPGALAACRRALAGERTRATAVLGGRRVELQLTPSRDAAGGVAGAHGMAVAVADERAGGVRRASEAHYRALVRTLPHIAIFLVDRDLRFLLAEGGALEAQGYDRAALVGRPLLDVLSAPNAAAILPHCRAALAGEERNSTITREGRSFEIRSRPLREDSGAIVGALIVSKDVTARYLAESALAERETRHRMILNALQEGVVLQDAEGRIVAANPAAEELLGLTIDQMRGLTSLDPRWRAIREDGSPCPGEEHPAAIALRTGRPQRDVVMGVRRVDQELIWLLVTAEPLHDPRAARPRGVVASFVDITARKRAEAAVQASEARYRAQVDHSRDAVLLTTPDGAVISANPAACHLFRGTEADLCARGREGLIDVTDPRLPAILAERARTGQVTGEIVCRRLDGTTFPAEFTSVVFRDTGGALRTNLTVRDISARKEAEAAQAQLLREKAALAARFQSLLVSAPDAIVVANGQGLIELVNQQTEVLFGYERDALHGQPVEILLPERYRTRHRAHRAAYVAAPYTRRMGAGLELFGRRADGSEFPIEVSLSAVETGGKPTITAVIRDMTEHKYAEAVLRAREAQLAHLAAHDPLTGLPNRRRLGEVIGAALNRLHRENTPVALLYLDLDDFKEVNDRLGHEAGDYLLGETANRLRACTREGDTPARLGGDEFAILLEGAGAREVQAIAARVVRRLAEATRIGAAVVTTSTSVGAVIAAPGDTPEVLLRRADAALYAAKRAGKGQFLLALD